MSADVANLEGALGYSFTGREVLVRALTHKSFRFENPSTLGDLQADNEQLEHLGDAILGFVVSETLFRHFPELPEGGLSKRKAHLVSAHYLYQVARALDLGDYLLLGKGEEFSGGRQKRALLADALEALIAALYLDGGLEVARRFIVERIIREDDLDGDGGDEPLNDFKSALQEMTQAMQLPPPRYSIVKEQGPEHSKTFTVEVRVGREYSSRAEGFSKKSAGQKAAQQVVEQLTLARGRLDNGR